MVVVIASCSGFVMFGSQQKPCMPSYQDVTYSGLHYYELTS